MDGTVANNPGTCTCAWACNDTNGSEIGIGGGCTGRRSDAAITEGRGCGTLSDVSTRDARIQLCLSVWIFADDSYSSTRACLCPVVYIRSRSENLLVSRLVFFNNCTMSGDRGLSASFHVGMLRSLQNRSNMDQQHLVPSGWNDAQRTLSSYTP